MTPATTAPESSADLQVGARPAVAWPLPYYLAALGVFWLVYQSIGWVGWLADGPVQLTRYRDPDTVSWYLCRAWEAMAIIQFLVLAPIVVREAIRGKTLTFDLMFCLATLSIYWIDPLANFFAPNFLFSQNWVNLSDWTGYLPFSQNPDAGRIAEPVLFNGLNYATGWLSFVMMICAVMRATQRRWPSIGKPALVLVAMVFGAVVDLLLEYPMYYYETWAFPGSPEFGFMVGTPHKFPATELLSGAIMFGLCASVRYFRDERGLSFVERGMEHLSEARRKTIALLAMSGLFATVYVLDNAMYCFTGLLSGPYPAMVPHISNAACDAPGVSNSLYGPCPGSPGFQLPLHGSLAGPPAFNDERWLNGAKQCPDCADVIVQTP